MISPRLRPTSSASVELACWTNPAASTVRNPHGATSRMGSRSGGSLRSSGSCGTRKVLPDGIDRLVGMAEMRAVPGRGELAEGAARRVPSNVLTDSLRRDRIIGALQNERRDGKPGQVGTVIAQERRLRELPRDHGIGRTERLVELGRELGPLAVLRDDR